MAPPFSEIHTQQNAQHKTEHECRRDSRFELPLEDGHKTSFRGLANVATK
jgi:hypothetical protein